MKIFFTLVVTIMSSNMAMAIEQSTIDALIKQGMQVKMGELTGAGSKFSLHKLAGFILEDGVLMKEDCRAIIIKPTIDPKISDIVNIRINNHEISSNEFVGFVVR